MISRVLADTGPIVAFLGRVLTLDKDFHLYRTHGRHVIPTTMPGEG